jgi:hypothetical protein
MATKAEYIAAAAALGKMAQVYIAQVPKVILERFITMEELGQEINKAAIAAVDAAEEARKVPAEPPTDLPHPLLPAAPAVA